MAFRYKSNPHNALYSLANYQCEVIADKLKAGSLEGITLDSMSAVIAMAFFTEALVNYVGAQRVHGWKEREKSPIKLQQIAKAIGVKLDIHVEPFATIVKLREVRNAMAHGQPTVRTIQPANKVELTRMMRTPWGEAVEPEKVLAMYDQLKAFRSLVFTKAGIHPLLATDSAMGGF
ncbi:hypothetical protein [Cupriavidus sp. TMH.W2]|uniref:hypothetical protein n=1 Tax=Cupriavidus sp. TMH.W2 TaxID=3434465 RepID=UPI003D786D54